MIHNPKKYPDTEPDNEGQLCSQVAMSKLLPPPLHTPSLSEERDRRLQNWGGGGGGGTPCLNC